MGPAGALKQPTGQQVYDDVKDTMVDEKHWYQSKVGGGRRRLLTHRLQSSCLLFEEKLGRGGAGKGVPTCMPVTDSEGFTPALLLESSWCPPLGLCLLPLA